MISNLFRLKVLLLALLPLAAWAATATTAPVDPLEQITFWQWARVIMFTLFGWLIGRMVNARVKGDLAQLKRVLEGGEASG